MSEPDFSDVLKASVLRFQQHVFPKHRILFEKRARVQNQKALFITCADSRVVPSLLTHPSVLQAEPSYREDQEWVDAEVAFLSCSTNTDPGYRPEYWYARHRSQIN